MTPQPARRRRRAGMVARPASQTRISDIHQWRRCIATMREAGSMPKPSSHLRGEGPCILQAARRDRPASAVRGDRAIRRTPAAAAIRAAIAAIPAAPPLTARFFPDGVQRYCREQKVRGCRARWRPAPAGRHQVRPIRRRLSVAAKTPHRAIWRGRLAKVRSRAIALLSTGRKARRSVCPSSTRSAHRLERSHANHPVYRLLSQR